MRRLQSCGFAFLLLAGAALAQGRVPTGDMATRGLTDRDFPRITRVADDVYAYEMIRQPLPAAVQAGRPERFTTNSLIVVTTGGVVVVDGQGSPADTAQLVEEIGRMTNQPIRYVILGSEHGDHTGGNSAFPSTATFITHSRAKAAFERQANAPNRNPAAPPVVIPSETVDDRRMLRVGNTDLEILFLGRAHTGNDLAVYLPQSKVLWMSEVYSHRLFPTLGGGYPSEWIQAIEKAEAMDVSYYLPAHGFIDDAATMKTELAEYRRAIEKVIAEARRLYTPGGSAEEAFPRADLEPYTGWTSGFLLAERSFVRAWQEVAGELN